MKISELTSTLEQLTDVTFFLPDGRKIPTHSHLTEIGVVQKTFVDCGGTLRTEQYIDLQLWHSVDVWHRLSPKKMIAIIHQVNKTIDLPDAEVRVSYQGRTIENYGLSVRSKHFYLVPLQTDCLAKVDCGISSEPIKKVVTSITGCDPSAGCC